ncbi:hypothetical protein ASF62_12040 [Leifsonia sp. Leaf325]|nr:hypothetical protein [Leifsonia sp. Leaf325]KQQ92574.1 hypothetical protein ASF62_12040 [Leifsonia sp. Leaf325]
MLLADVGAALLGRQTADLIRAVALFDEGCPVQLLAGILDRDIQEVANDVDRLFDTGVLWAPEIDRIAANRFSSYWPGISSLLDTNVVLEQALALLGERLGGPGTRVALYGATPIESMQFVPKTRMVLLLPGIRTDPRVSVHDELTAMADDVQFITLVHTEPPEVKDVVIATADANAIRAWLNADDVRALPPVDEGSHLEWACRQVEVGLGTKGGAENAKNPRHHT